MIVYNNTTTLEISVYNMPHRFSLCSPMALVIRIMLGFGMDYVMVSDPHIDHWEDYNSLIGVIRKVSLREGFGHGFEKIV